MEFRLTKPASASVDSLYEMENMFITQFTVVNRKIIMVSVIKIGFVFASEKYTIWSTFEYRKLKCLFLFLIVIANLKIYLDWV